MPTPILHPNTGLTLGGDIISVKWAGFATGTTVTFGGVAASSIVITDSSDLTCVTPVHPAAGAVDVVITNPDATTVTIALGYTYATLSTSFPPSGSFSFSATGALLASGGFFASPPFDPTDILTVLQMGYNYYIRSILPSGGGAVPTVATGTSPTVYAGSGSATFSGDPTSLLINGVLTSIAALPANFTITGDLLLNVEIWGDTWPGDILTAQFSNSVTFSLAFGYTVQEGYNFSYPQTDPPTAPLPSLSTLLAGTFGFGLTTVAVPGGTPSLPGRSFSEISSLFVTGTYVIPPTITPNTGLVRGGDIVTIAGFSVADGATVTFDGLPATNITIIDATHLTCITPAHAAATVDVVITNTDTTTATISHGYTYVASPGLNIYPQTGNQGTKISLTGLGFNNPGPASDYVTLPNGKKVPRITFNGVPGTSVVDIGADDTNVVSHPGATTLTCIVPKASS